MREIESIPVNSPEQVSQALWQARKICEEHGYDEAQRFMLFPLLVPMLAARRAIYDDQPSSGVVPGSLLRPQNGPLG